MGISSSVSPKSLKKTLKIRKYKDKEIITNYNCKLKEFDRIFSITPINEIDGMDIFYDDNLIKNGYIFKGVFDGNKKRIIKELSVYFSHFENKCQIKVIIDANINYKSIPKGNNTKNINLISLKVDENFIFEYCGLDIILNNKNIYNDGVIKIYKNFILVYCTNFNTFKTYIGEEYSEEDLKLFYFKGEEDNIYIKREIFENFDMFIKKNVLCKFNYINLEKIRVLPFSLETKSKKFKNFFGIKLKYYEFYSGGEKKKMYKIKLWIKKSQSKFEAVLS